MDETEMQERRAEKQREAPMHPSLKTLVIASAQRQREMEAAAKVTTICTCEGHTHNLWEALREAWAEDYRRKMHAALDNKTLDIGGLLRRAGCPEFAVTRIAHGGMDERPTLYSAKLYQGVMPDRIGPSAQNVRLLVAAQLQQRQRRPYLGLFGDTDRGKTAAAVWAMAQSMRRFSWNSGATGSNQAFPFAFVRMAEFAGVLVWDAPTREWLERLKRARLVILDDMGKEHLSPAAQMMLFELLDTRYGQGASTVITSQLKVAEFQMRYDGTPGPDGKAGAIFRRLKERGVILRDAGDAGAKLMSGETEVKRWPKVQEADVVPLRPKKTEPRDGDE